MHSEPLKRWENSPKTNLLLQVAAGLRHRVCRGWDVMLLLPSGRAASGSRLISVKVGAVRTSRGWRRRGLELEEKQGGDIASRCFRSLMVRSTALVMAETSRFFCLLVALHQGRVISVEVEVGRWGRRAAGGDEGWNLKRSKVGAAARVLSLKEKDEKERSIKVSVSFEF